MQVVVVLRGRALELIYEAHDFIIDVRGNDGGKCLQVGNLFRNWNADIICLQEIEVKHIPCSTLCRVRSQHVDWCCLDSI